MALQAARLREGLNDKEDESGKALAIVLERSGFVTREMTEARLPLNKQERGCCRAVAASGSEPGSLCDVLAWRCGQGAVASFARWSKTLYLRLQGGYMKPIDNKAQPGKLG
jgi:hypothetical protein